MSQLGPRPSSPQSPRPDNEQAAHQGSPAGTPPQPGTGQQPERPLITKSDQNPADGCRSFLLEALPTDRQTPANRHARCPAKPEHGTPTGSLICVSNGVSMAVADAGRRAVRSE